MSPLKNSVPKTISISLAIAILISAASTLAGYGEMIDGFTVDKIDDQAITTLSLRTPVRYIGHFPDSEGRELKIRIQTTLRKSFANTGRESVSPPVNECPLIKEVTVDRSTGDDYYLTYYFAQTARYTVQQQIDPQQIIVILHNLHDDEAGNPCNVRE